MDAGPAGAPRPRCPETRAHHELRALERCRRRLGSPGSSGRPGPPGDLGSAALLGASVYQPGLAPGASRELAPVEPQAFTRPPWPPAFPPRLRWKAAAPGTPTIAQRRCRAPLLHSRPGSPAGTAEGPVAAKLADPRVAAASVSAAVRPRAAPPPSWPRPARRARPRSAFSPARPTHAEAWPLDRLPLNPAS